MGKRSSNKDVRTLPFMDRDKDVEERISDLLGRLTLDEKFKLMSGRKFLYSAGGVKRLRIRPFGVTDGPRGVVAFSTLFKRNTLLPTNILLASTWDPGLAYKYGEVMGKETRACGKYEIFGPGVNIVRTPLCGRTFEYFTEDPFLNSKMAVQVVKGIQDQRISACVKHFICNNQETRRGSYNANVSERALREIYLPAFKAAVMEGGAWSVMSCYNRVNGVYGSEHERLIREVLMGEFGFKGFVISDWYATRRIETTEGCVKGGLSLEMPDPMRYKVKNLKKALSDGKITLEMVDELVRRFLRVMFYTGCIDGPDSVPKGVRNTPEHQAFARQVAEEGIVLLKNEGGLLPLEANSISRVSVTGPNARKKLGKPLYGGSSAVWPPFEVTPLEGIRKRCGDAVKVISSPADADVAIVVVGLDHGFGKDSEGFDRKTLNLPASQVKLIKETANLNKNTIVILVNGSPVNMNDWLDDVPAVVEAWYSGMHAGDAIASIIFGDKTPSGKLPVTFPKRLEDCPAHQSEETFPGTYDENGILQVHYKEGIYVGYRHFDKHGIEPLFPFGFGLSYTTFDLDNLELDKDFMAPGGEITVKCRVRNTGDRTGAEVVQLYLQDVECTVDRPPKELKGFSKVWLEPGQERVVGFRLGEQDLAFYDEKERTWKVENGEFRVLVGTSSRNIRLEGHFDHQG